MNKLLIILMLTSDLYSFDNGSLSSNRTGKFIGWWGVGVVRFENTICGAANGLLGICYTRRQCSSIGGYQSGKCAKNIGACCVYQATCGGTSSNNNTYFSNPTFPSTFNGGGSCTLTIQRCNPDICQLRIDLLSFNLAQPNPDGVCISDAMVISGSGTFVGRICGDNTGLHLYVDFDGGKDIVINIFTSAAVSFGRQWNLRIAQIGCDSPSRAPTGCLMYYTSTSGNVRSFNFGQAVSALGTRQLASMNYGICIQPQPGFCSIQWSAADNAFLVSGTALTGSLVGVSCITDYVVIPASGNDDRYCGSALPTVTSIVRPFVLYVVTDTNEALDTENKGFSLAYTQQQCTNFL